MLKLLTRMIEMLALLKLITYLFKYKEIIHLNIDLSFDIHISLGKRVSNWKRFKESEFEPTPIQE